MCFVAECSKTPPAQVAEPGVNACRSSRPFAMRLLLRVENGPFSLRNAGTARVTEICCLECYRTLLTKGFLISSVMELRRM